MQKSIVSFTVGLLAAGAVFGSAFAGEGQRGGTATPIKHLVVIFQENVSFDHYFATCQSATNPPGEPRFEASIETPSVNGLQGSLLTHNPNATNSANGEGATNPFRLDRSQAATADQDHDYTPEQMAFDHGLMDAFPASVGTAGRRPRASPIFATTGLTMGYYDGNTVTALSRLRSALRHERQLLRHELRAFDAPGAINHSLRADQRRDDRRECRRLDHRRRKRRPHPHQRCGSGGRRLLDHHRRCGAVRRQERRRSVDGGRRDLGILRGRLQSQHRQPRRQHDVQAPATPLQ